MTKTSYHHGNLRQALIDAALRTLEEEGVDGLSLRKVARQAGVSATALYSHFKDKRELLAVLATGGFRGLTASMQEELDAAAGEGGESSPLLALAQGYVRFATNNTALFQLMFGREVGEMGDFPELVEVGGGSYSMMADHVARQLADRGSPADPAVAATAAWSLVHGMATLVNDGRLRAGDCGADSTEEMVRRACRLMSFGD